MGMSFHQLPRGTVFLNHVTILSPTLNAKVFIRGGTEVLVSPWGERRRAASPHRWWGPLSAAVRPPLNCRPMGACCGTNLFPIQQSAVFSGCAFICYLLVYVADDDGDIFNTLLAQVTLKRAEKAPKRSQRLGCSCRGLSCPWGRGEQAQPRSRPGRALPL